MKILNRRLSRLTVVGIIITVLCAGVVAAATYTWVSNTVNYTVTVHGIPITLSGNFVNQTIAQIKTTQYFEAEITTTGLSGDNYQGYVMVSLTGLTGIGDVEATCKVTNLNYPSGTSTSTVQRTYANGVITYVFGDLSISALNFDGPSLSKSVIELNITYANAATISNAKIQLTSTKDLPMHWISNAQTSSFIVNALMVKLVAQDSKFQTDVIQGIPFDTYVKYSAWGINPTGFIHVKFTNVNAYSDTAITSCAVQTGENTYTTVIDPARSSLYDPQTRTSTWIFGVNPTTGFTFPLTGEVGGYIKLTIVYHTLASHDISIQISSDNPIE